MRHLVILFIAVASALLTTNSAYAFGSDDAIAQLMEIQGGLDKQQISLQQAAAQIQELQAEIAKISDGDESTSLMRAAASVDRDIAALTAQETICYGKRDTACITAAAKIP